MALTVISDQDLLTEFERLALAGGKQILRVYCTDCAVLTKADKSPVTEADEAAEVVILEGLRAAFPDVCCVAEEEIAQGKLPPGLGDAFFLVDPLDGTKEFVNRRPDFTVNIALVRKGSPEIGVVYAPASGKLYGGRPGHAYEAEIDADFLVTGRKPIAVRARSGKTAVVASRSHRTKETDDYIDKLGEAEIVSVGSSLKFCILACGKADIYPRFGRTMEWDTAAGDAVLRAAGGRTETLGGKPLSYGKRQQANDIDFANPYFIATGG